MKKQLVACLAMVALASSALAVVQTNTVSWGPVGNSGWDDNVVTNGGSPVEYSITIGPPAEYTELSNLTFTVTFTETNGIPIFVAQNWLCATIDDGVVDRRLNSNEVLRLKASYSDPDHALLGLRVSGFGTTYNTVSYETMVFSDGVNSTSVTASANDTIFDYEASGLSPVTTNNISSWEMFVSVDDTLGGGTNFTEAGMGALVLEYIADSAYVPPPPPPEPVVFTFPNGNGLDSVGVGGSITLDNITITTVDVIGQDLSLASEGADNYMNTTSANNLGVRSANNVIGNSQNPRDFDPNEGWVFSFSTNVYLREIDFAGWGTELPSEMTLSSSAFVSNIVLGGTSGNGTFTFPEDTYVPKGTAVTMQMSGETNSAIADIAVRISYFTVQIAPELVTTTPYEDWASGQGLTVGLNDGYGDDAEAVPDGMDNLLEYALGADPMVDDAAAFLPGYAILADGSTNYLNYVYRRRVDYAARGLSYNVGSATDLVFDELTNSTVEVNSGPIDAKFESVTNRVSTDVESKQFMQLKVTID